MIGLFPLAFAILVSGEESEEGNREEGGKLAERGVGKKKKFQPARLQSQDKRNLKERRLFSFPRTEHENKKEKGRIETRDERELCVCLKKWERCFANKGGDFLYGYLFLIVVVLWFAVNFLVLSQRRGKKEKGKKRKILNKIKYKKGFGV